MTFPSTLLPMPAQTLALSRYDVACRALAQARAVDDVMEVVAHADVVRVYARRQAKNRQMEIDAAEIRIRAERRLGELMSAQKARVGVNSGAAGQGRPKIGGVPNTPPKHDAPPTLAEAGIDKNLAKRSRSYAAVPTEQFEQLLTDKRQSGNRRVVLDPGIPAAAGDIDSGRDEHIVQIGASGAGVGNGRLARLGAGLRRRLAALIEENGALKDREKMWKERALAAGRSERAA
ncbi:hypothetical protein BH10PSE6_BH10PSE6_55020 [soil metagenome]